MKVTLECPHCQKRLKVDTAQMGQKARCPACKQMMMLPEAPPAPDPAPVVSQPVSAPVSEPTAPSVFDDLPADEWSMGPADESVDPLGAPSASRRPRSRRSSMPSSNRSKGKSFFARMGPKSWFMLVIAALLGLEFLVLLVVSFVSPAHGMAISYVGIIGTFIVALAIGLAANIWILVIAFQEDVVCGLLCMFCPFYIWYYIITRLDKTWFPTLICLLFPVVCVVPIANAVIAFGLMALSATSEDAETETFEFNGQEFQYGPSEEPKHIEPPRPSGASSASNEVRPDRNQPSPSTSADVEPDLSPPWPQVWEPRPGEAVIEFEIRDYSGPVPESVAARQALSDIPSCRTETVVYYSKPKMLRFRVSLMEADIAESHNSASRALAAAGFSIGSTNVLVNPLPSRASPSSTPRPSIPRPSTPTISPPMTPRPPASGSRGFVAEFEVIDYRGSSSPEAAARSALRSNPMFDSSTVEYDELEKVIRVRSRGMSVSTASAKAALQSAGFAIGRTSVRSVK